LNQPNALETTLTATGACLLAAWAPAALAYVGPGAGLGMIATLFAMVLAVIATVVGLILWPIRKLRSRRKSGEAATRDNPSR
jgi:hypothetical protein